MSADPLIESVGVEDASGKFRREHPETFARYLARRKVVFLVAYVGYVCAYLVRNNFKLTSEEMRLANGWSLTQVGLILTAFTITYGFGKFLMGMVVDRTSLRKTFSLALGVSAGICICIGFIRSLPWLFIAMLLLGMVQGALAPASMTMIANWYPNRTRGAGIAIWNTSQNLGGAGLPLIITALLAWNGPGGSLAIAFWAPGIVVSALSFLFWRIGGDRPEREGFGTLDDIYGEAGSRRITPFVSPIFARQEMVADGALRDLDFDVPVPYSSWVALCILGLCRVS